MNRLMNATLALLKAGITLITLELAVGRFTYSVFSQRVCVCVCFPACVLSVFVETCVRE